MKAFYITTTLPYVNSDPHLGFALELVQADIIARYRTLQGDDVFFNTGTDEHGLKIYRKAQESGKDTQAYTDEYATKFRQLKERMNLHPELHFIRTTDPHHKKAAQEMWKRCEAAGDIYKKKYKGLYCVGDEAFLKDSDLVDGKCPNHPSMDPIEVEEENYFFRLSNYQDKLRDYLSKEGVIVPEWRRQEAIQFVEKGLEDFSISRVKEKMPWGVPVPGDDSQVMYVWFDALTNYISTLGWPEDAEGNFKKYWENGQTLQLAGKDQVRFQSVMWQAMLMSAGLPDTKQVFYHGFITSGGQKMSKSLGNVVDPNSIIHEYNEIGADGKEVLRHFLTQHVHPFNDTDITSEFLKVNYNAHLADGLGNTVSRLMRLAESALSEPVKCSKPTEPPPVYKLAFDSKYSGIEEEDRYRFRLDQASAEVFDMAKKIDAEINRTEPFKLLKTAPEEGKKIISHLVQELFNVTCWLEPFMPNTSLAIFEAIRNNKKPENLFPRKE